MFIIIIYPIDYTQIGGTALHCAVSNGHFVCAQLLIQAGAIVDKQDVVSTVKNVYTATNSFYIYEMYSTLMINRLDVLLCIMLSEMVTLNVPNCL